MRIVNGVANYLHTDQVGSVRLIMVAFAVETTYCPFGEAVDIVSDPTAALETMGFIGERFDMDPDPPNE